MAPRASALIRNDEAVGAEERELVRTLCGFHEPLRPRKPPIAVRSRREHEHHDRGRNRFDDTRTTATRSTMHSATTQRVRAPPRPALERAPETPHIAEAELFRNLLELHVRGPDPLFGAGASRFVEQSLERSAHLLQTSSKRA